MRELFLCGFLVACGFEANPPVGVAGPDAALATPMIDASVAPLTPARLIEQVVTVECANAFACKQQYPSGSFDEDWGSTMTECLTDDRDYRDIPAINSAIAAGRITFDPVRAAVCLADPGIPTTCSVLFADTYEWASSCYDALVGHVADGQACTTGWECGRFSNCRNATCSHN